MNFSSFAAGVVVAFSGYDLVSTDNIGYFPSN